MAAHFERNHRKGEKEPDPEAPPHIAIFFAGAVRCCRHDGLECHAADRAASGAGALDFGMHRAGPDGAFGCIGCGRLAFCGIKIGIGLEFGEAACAAEIVMLAAMRRGVRCGGRIDRHAADGIGRAPAAFFCALMIVHRRRSRMCRMPASRRGGPNATGRVRRWRRSWRFQNGAASIDTQERRLSLGFSLPCAVRSRAFGPR
jgi:hypothetical protein